MHDGSTSPARPKQGSIESEERNHCTNCGAVTASAYCPSCGQAQAPLVITLRQWLRDFVGETFHLEGRLPATAVRLLTKPGALTKDWLEGRRVRYLSPIAVYTIAAIVFFFASSWIGGSAYVFSPDDPDTRISLQRVMRVFLPLASVPMLTVTSRLSFRSLQPSLTPNIVFSLNVHGYLLLIAAILAASARALSGTGWVPDRVLLITSAGVFVLGAFSYMTAATRRVWGITWLRALGGTTLMIVQYAILLLPVFGIGVAVTLVLTELLGNLP